ncbi:unnamed protein product [Arctogadus glacialis]
MVTSHVTLRATQPAASPSLPDGGHLFPNPLPARRPPEHQETHGETHQPTTHPPLGEGEQLWKRSGAHHSVAGQAVS